MTIDNGTFIGLVSVAGGALAVGGGWVISVEKRINGLKYLHERVKTQGIAVRRIDRLTVLIAYRLGVEDPEPAPEESDE